MSSRFRPPMFVVAAALLALIAVLATLQYRWLGRISAAERERMTANLAMHSSAVALDFDMEVTRAYATFQMEPAMADANIATRLAQRYERWVATARYPRLVRDIYIVPGEERPEALQRFNAATRFVEPIEWPADLRPIRDAMSRHAAAQPPPAPHDGPATFMVRTLPPSVWEEIPALVIAMPIVFINTVEPGARPAQQLRFAQLSSFVIVQLDRDYIAREMLPALIEQRFRAAGDGGYQMAVVSSDSNKVIYRSHDRFTPSPDAKVDARADLFQVRTQELGAIMSELRRFSSVSAQGSRTTVEVHRLESTTPGRLGLKDRTAIIAGANTSMSRPVPGPRWRLLVKHPSGSLEAAVNLARRRNLAVSFGVLALVGVSVGFLVVTTRRAQELARQQMEFVAAVSHELRTPLAVIRSAADNLAEGVVADDPQVRKYGDLVRGEGRRLTEMVEQILELAGIQSGQRGFALRPVPVVALLHDTVRAASTLIDEAGIEVEFDAPESLPPVLGDEPALRRVFQNLVGNALKYGAGGRWIGLTARASGREVIVTVADRGMGIPAAEQVKIFEPFYRSPGVVAAQIHGAGLGLSLVQRIVEAHGGRISVRSVEGQGSAFTVHLPAAGEESQPVIIGQTHPSH